MNINFIVVNQFVFVNNLRSEIVIFIIFVTFYEMTENIFFSSVHSKTGHRIG